MEAIVGLRGEVPRARVQLDAVTESKDLQSTWIGTALSW